MEARGSPPAGPEGRPAACAAQIAITVLGGFDCTVGGRTVALPLPGQRVLALLALDPAGAHRAALARRLWPDGAPSRVAANLRSALWQVRHSPAAPALRSAGPRLWLDDGVVVDIHPVARHVLGVVPGAVTEAVDPRHLVPVLRRDLLTGWDDGWLAIERERWDTTRLHALEALAGTLLGEKDFARAHGAALETIALDPVREAGHRLVVEIHLAEGEPASALAHYRRYRALLHARLGIVPSPLMEELVRPLTG